MQSRSIELFGCLVGRQLAGDALQSVERFDQRCPRITHEVRF
jgi:hypothetical protein